MYPIRKLYVYWYCVFLIYLQGIPTEMSVSYWPSLHGEGTERYGSVAVKIDSEETILDSVFVRTFQISSEAVSENMMSIVW